MSRRPKSRKGVFGDADLPVADAYPTPPSRRPMLLAGVAAAAAILALVLYAQIFAGGRWASKGPLSSAHAAFLGDCSACHQSGAREVTNEKCSTCHEKFGNDLGIFTFASHYVYRSDDFRRVVPAAEEVPCFACHTEHEGRHAEITRVPDARCGDCHFASFGRDHPQFDFAAEEIADHATLRFTHIHHMREVMKRLESEDVEAVCLACHEPRPDGTGFESIAFDRHCDACHLTATTATPGLPILGAEGVTVGVETLEQIVAKLGAEASWAYFTNPNEFRVRGSLVVKAPVHHRDPWILANLRRLRRRLYPQAGLADLLETTPDAEPHETRLLYREAIRELEKQAAGLRGRPEPEIQDELKGIGEVLERLKRRVGESFAPLDETDFLLSLERRDPQLPEEEEAAIDQLIVDLTTPCRACHQISAATVARVQKDQRQLRRADFNHRAHVVQARCLDCHGEIPIAEGLGGESEKIDEAVDNAAIQNLPRIETCRECHSARQASDRCITCHLFHPDQSHRARLLVAREVSP